MSPIDRYRTALSERSPFSEKSMMGGICFMVGGHMSGGFDHDEGGNPRFMFRVGKAQYEEALDQTESRPVILGSRRMGGMVYVLANDLSRRQLEAWIARTLKFVAQLPPR